MFSQPFLVFLQVAESGSFFQGGGPAVGHAGLCDETHEHPWKAAWASL